LYSKFCKISLVEGIFKPTPNPSLVRRGVLKYFLLLITKKPQVTLDITLSLPVEYIAKSQTFCSSPSGEAR